LNVIDYRELSKLRVPPNLLNHLSLVVAKQLCSSLFVISFFFLGLPSFVLLLSLSGNALQTGKSLWELHRQRRRREDLRVSVSLSPLHLILVQRKDIKVLKKPSRNETKQQQKSTACFSLTLLFVFYLLFFCFFNSPTKNVNKRAQAEHLPQTTKLYPSYHTTELSTFPKPSTKMNSDAKRRASVQMPDNHLLCARNFRHRLSVPSHNYAFSEIKRSDSFDMETGEYRFRAGEMKQLQARDNSGAIETN